MHEELRDVRVALQDFLGVQLPDLYPDWWNVGVINALTYAQREKAQENAWSTLEDLDLAALIRVADQNWGELRRRQRVTFETRTLLKECSSIRNRWAHEAASREPTARQNYRDLDTLALLVTALSADEDVIQRLEAARDEALGALSPAQDSDPVVVPEPNTLPEEDDSLFSVGTQVRLTARPEIIGVVVETDNTGPETRFRVFHDGQQHTYYASQIELDESISDGATISAELFHAGLTSLQLMHPSTQHLYSFSAGRIEYEPYQFRPVIKLIEADRPRLLIADDVGVGKTIEAGLILKELQARQRVSSVLVICPKPLVTESKWRTELKRFDEDFEHLDGPGVRQCLEETRLEGRWPNRFKKAIVPYSLLDEQLLLGSEEGRRKNVGLVELDPQPQFDLVIVDEAHHIRNTDTWRHRNVRQLISGAEAVVFLTATPVQMGSDDLFNLLSLLRPDLIASRRNFDQMREPNPYLLAAEEAARSGEGDWQSQAQSAISESLQTPWGSQVLAADPKMGELQDILAEPEASPEDRVTAIRLTTALYTFASLINRTRRRDIGAFTTRKPETREVPFTQAQQEIYSKLIELCRQIAVSQSPKTPVGFMVSTLQRQAASCLNGLAPLIEDILYARMSVEEVSEVDDLEEHLSHETLDAFGDDVSALVDVANTLGDEDPKFDSMQAVVMQKQEMTNNKVLVFSTFRHTLKYLDRRLQESGVRVGLVHGGIAEDDRRSLRARFKLPKQDPDALDVLLSSEVGTEGLDYQFCDTLINYDLPWNPMRIEQRIGRLDRRGQKSETIAIVNMITPGTVDATIYDRCLTRIGVFQAALGGSEEILGDLTRGIRNIGENLQLSEEERAQRLQQLTDNEISRIQEQNQLEKDQEKFFGLAIQQQADAEVNAAHSSWLSPQRIGSLVHAYLSALDPQKSLAKFEQPVVTLRPNEKLRATLLEEFLPLQQDGSVDTRWASFLRGTTPAVLLSVQQAEVQDRPDIELLTPTHPLVRAAARWAAFGSPPQVTLRVRDDQVTPGTYPFGVYSWSRLGTKDDASLQPVSEDQNIQSQFAALLAQASDAPTAVTISPEQLENIENRHYAMWSDARVSFREGNRSTLDAQLNSLRATHGARITQLEEQYASTQDPKIQRMRSAQIDSAEQDYAARVNKLQDAYERCDIISELVATGVLIIE